jgi:Rrf2 family protein
VHLTRQSDYGVRAVLHLSSVTYGQVVQTKEIAAQEDIPRKYLPSIIRTLARAGIIRTLRGNQGGVMLARPPEEINLRDVIEAIEGPIILVQCMRGPGQCAHEDSCSFLPVCKSVQQMMVGQLEGTTFADLASNTYVEAGNLSRLSAKRAASRTTSRRNGSPAGSSPAP